MNILGGILLLCMELWFRSPSLETSIRARLFKVFLSPLGREHLLCLSAGLVGKVLEGRVENGIIRVLGSKYQRWVPDQFCALVFTSVK